MHAFHTFVRFTDTISKTVVKKKLTSTVFTLTHPYRQQPSTFLRPTHPLQCLRNIWTTPLSFYFNILVSVMFHKYELFVRIKKFQMTAYSKGLT